jgi:hypothetical protein
LDKFLVKQQGGGIEMKKFNGVLILVLALFLVVGISSMVAACVGMFCCDFGDDAYIVQRGTSHEATIYQKGERFANKPWYMGGDPCLPVGCVAGGNYASVQQMGNGHKALISQIGAMNFASVRSTGKGQDAVIYQDGVGQVAVTTQHGNGNSLVIRQLGAFNAASVDQDGCRNTALVRQLGNYDYASISQSGNRNDAKIIQH